MEWLEVSLVGFVAVLVALSIYLLWRYDKMKWEKVMEEMENRVEEAIEKYEERLK